MGKIMQSAVVLLLATNVFAHKPSAHSHRVKTAKKAQSVAYKEAAIPSQSGMWINSGGGVCCLYARNIDRTGKQDAMLNILSIGTGAQIRYQRNSCIYSMGFLASWAPVLVTAVDKNQTPTKYTQDITVRT